MIELSHVNCDSIELLVDVGGSDKQGLLSISIDHESYQIRVTSSHGLGDFKENMMGLYQTSGIKRVDIAFIMTDGEIVKE